MATSGVGENFLDVKIQITDPRYFDSGYSMPDCQIPEKGVI